jgi:hypothetical protein
MTVAALRSRRKRRVAATRSRAARTKSAAHFKSPNFRFMFVRRQFVWIITVLARTAA